eukprot:4723718-Prorocentrum_lima.AAC.1
MKSKGARPGVRSDDAPCQPREGRGASGHGVGGKGLGYDGEGDCSSGFLAAGVEALREEWAGP